MSYHVVSPFTSLPSESINEKNKYPYLIVRLMASVYQRHHITVYKGEESVEISHHRNFVRYPEPVIDNGVIIPSCRAYLLDAVLQAVKSTGFRMAVVWGEKEVSYVEKDESIEESTEPPTGGVPLPNKIAFDKQIRIDPAEEPYTEEGISKTGFVLKKQN